MWMQAHSTCNLQLLALAVPHLLSEIEGTVVLRTKKVQEWAGHKTVDTDGQHKQKRLVINNITTQDGLKPERCSANDLTSSTTSCVANKYDACCQQTNNNERTNERTNQRTNGNNEQRRTNDRTIEQRTTNISNIRQIHKVCTWY